MADKINTNYKLIEPEVGASQDSWGSKLNDNWNKVDSLLHGDSFTDLNANIVKKIAPDLEGGQFKIDGVAVTASASDLNATTGILDSPALTGTPTAPTATSDTDTTQIATTEFVQSLVATGKADAISSANANTSANYLPLSGGTLDGGTSTTLNIKCDDSGQSMIRLNGNSQGTGIVEVGQDSSYGGGMFYNGDGTPAFASGESSDYISFYRLSAGVRTVVFDYGHTSSTVRFKGDISIAGTVYETSDARVKSNVEKICGALGKINQINGYTYNKEGYESRHTGLIAQEVIEVLPEAVTTNEDGQMSVAYGNLVGLLVEAIKEQQGQIDDLKSEIMAVKASK
jgi:hypothetical protein